MTAPALTAPDRRGPFDRPRAVLDRYGYWLLVALFAVESQRQVWVEFDGSAHARARVAVLTAVSLAALVFARQLPLLGLLTTATIALLLNVDDPETVVYGPALAVGVAAYALGRRGTDREGLIGLPVGLALVVAGELLDSYPTSVGSLFSILLLSTLAPAGLGRATRERALVHAGLRERAAADEADRRLVAEQALLEERTKIAGELHDVVAHALSAMIVQATAARVQVGRDPARAADAFAAVEGAGRDALFELRSLLGVLRSAADADALEPQPSVDGLPLLVARTTASGLPTELEVRGTPRAVTPGTSLAAYRVVQDALHSARDHGAATGARVILDWGEGDGDLRLLVRDDGPAERPALSARERVLLYGGDLRLGRGRGGQHELGVRLPLRRPA